ncbi:MAG: hypothetical protein ABEJ62_00335, partial [Candidatus Nanohaloarchaea archaeon]
VNHSVMVEDGKKTIRHEVTKNGNTLVSFVKEIFVGPRASANAEAESDSGGQVTGDESEEGLNLEFTSNVSQGENATIEVTENGEAVANATVKVSGEVVGQTDAGGTATFTVPGEEKVKVKVEKGDHTAELEVEFESEAETGSSEANETGTESSASTEANSSNSGAEAEAELSAEASLQ